MYTIRRNRKIISSASNLVEGIDKFLKEVNHGVEPVLNAEEITNNRAVIEKFLEADKRFQWGPVTITKSAPREVRLSLHEAREQIRMLQSGIDHACIRYIAPGKDPTKIPDDELIWEEPKTTIAEARAMLAQLKADYPKWEKHPKAKGE